MKHRKRRPYHFCTVTHRVSLSKPINYNNPRCADYHPIFTKTDVLADGVPVLTEEQAWNLTLPYLSQWGLDNLQASEVTWDAEVPRYNKGAEPAWLFGIERINNSNGNFCGEISVGIYDGKTECVAWAIPRQYAM